MSIHIKDLLNDKIGWDKDELYQAGMENVIENIEFYFDKPYTCESVLKELFLRGVNKFIEVKKTQSLD